jgi:hypothetical protein
VAGTCEDAVGALAAHLGLPLEFKDGSCSFNVGGQPFTITNDDELDRLVVSALVADDLPEAAFYMVGDIDEAFEKAKTLE